MIETSDITTTTAALMIGLATSLHCVGMCGPIACGLGTLAKSEGDRLTATTLYHTTRLFSYTMIGAMAGVIGKKPLEWFFASPAVLLPWVLVLVLLLMATGLDRKLPRPPFLNRWAARARFKASRFSACGAASAMGLLTPFLPCGPLYGIFGAALLTGSAVKGAEFSLAFGLGTVPLLWLAQSQYHRIRTMLTPKAMSRLRRGLALVTALMLMWRLHGTLPMFKPPAHGGKDAPRELPTCCPH